MFGTDTVGPRAGEIPASSLWLDRWDEGEDEVAYRLTTEEAKNPLPATGLPSLPEDLEQLPSGVFLAAALHRARRTELSGHDLIRLLVARERLVSHYQADVASDMAEVTRLAPMGDPYDRSEETWDYASDEIRAALTLTRRSAEARLEFALQLAHSYPKVLSALSVGEIDMSRARVIVNSVSSLPIHRARELVDTVMARASELTTGQLGSWIRRLTVVIDPAEAKDRYENAIAHRRIWIEQTSDGTANLYAFDLPVDRLRSIGRRINGYVLALSGSDGRTHDQLRADVVLDLLDGAATGQPPLRAAIDIRVDLSTLARLNERSAEIPGFGPVIADIARQIAEKQDTRWRFTAVDEHGNAVADGMVRRRHTAAQRRSIESIDDTCVFPGCRMPATDCDIDHNVPWSERGPTSVCNGSPKCRHDHELKTNGGWKYRREDGRHRWTSPLGHTYITEREPP
jgi:hypothetical protein